MSVATVMPTELTTESSRLSFTSPTLTVGADNVGGFVARSRSTQ
jgi:hypothetical protein